MCLGVFTILHFGDTNVTFDCINSLMSLNNIDECRIVVLDNNSKTDILSAIKSKYGDKICVLKEKNNTGFTVGNNILYKKAKSYNPRFIAVLNNDIVIKQKNFINVLLRIIDTGRYHVICPDIYKPSSQDHQAPLFRSLPGEDDLETYMKWWNDIGNGSIVAEDNGMLSNKLHKISPDKITDFYRYIRYGKNDRKNYYLKETEDCVLQGACIIATDRYLDNEDVLFEPDTGFYFEELLLALKCKTKGYKSLYTPKLKVIHKHGMASKSDSINYQDYMVRNAKRMMTAYTVYLECLHNNPWSKYGNTFYQK